jgi:UDP-N-acetylglucosamine acyltransferase
MDQIHPSAVIHATAFVAPTAVIGEGCEIGPYSIIGPRVSMGRANKICSHVVIEGLTQIGDHNTFFQFASIGAPPQDLKFQGEESIVRIGDHNTIREFVTIQPGTRHGHMATRVGNHNLFMNSSHIGHDCTVGDHTVFANSSALAGHVIVGDHAKISGFCGIHQYVRLGEHCYIGGGAMVVKDIPPFCLAQGDRAALFGINTVGLKRAGFPADDIRALRQVYRKLFLGEGVFRARFETIRREYEGKGEHVDRFLGFIAATSRGITFPRKGREADFDAP